MTNRSLVARVVLVGSIVASASLGYRVFAAQNPPTPQEVKAAALAQLVEKKACQQCDLSGTSFTTEMGLRGADLAGAKLVGTSFYRLDLTNANFSDADLTNAVFSLSDVTNVNFGNANLDGANLARTTGASLTGAKTTETTVCPDGQHGPCR
jgi:uncharacterized protein YjbI with pentapeptide repeats